MISGGEYGGGMAAEPPCRQRRLEPWRQQVREQCRAVADTQCSSRSEGGERDLLSAFMAAPSSSSVSSPASTMMTMEKEIDSLFEDMFAHGRRSAPPEFVLQSQDGEEDPFDKLLNNMLGLSLGAFDLKTMMADPTAADPASSTGGVIQELPEEDNGEGEEEEGVGLPYALSFDSDGDENSSQGSGHASNSEDYLESAATPEQAAENALDVMVASLARSGALTGNNEEERVIISADHLTKVLSRLGNNLLADTNSRRRLQEGHNQDPHLRVKERLARRLTEYRTDLFYSPDGTVTLYTTGFSPVMPTPRYTSMFGPVSAPPSSPLGMGSRHLDECVRSHFDNRDLGGGCHRAVGEFLLAVDHGSPMSPHFTPRMNVVDRADSPVVEQLDVFVTRARNFSIWNVIMFFAALMSVVMMLEQCFGSAEDGEDEEGNQFDYTTLPEDESESANAEGGATIFVGVPVQVV